MSAGSLRSGFKFHSWLPIFRETLERKMLRPAIPFIILLALHVTSAMADVIRIPYQFVETGWLSEAREYSCELKQELPLFGAARFLRGTQQPVQLVIDSLVPVTRAGEGRLYSVLPSWKGGGEEEDIARLEIREGSRPISLPRAQALQVFYALYQGRAVNLEFDDLATGSSRILIQLSPIDFLGQVQAFEACVGRLAPVAGAGHLPTNAMIDENRIGASSPPAMSPSSLQLKPLPKNVQALSYQFDSSGKPAPVRIRIP